MKIQHYILSAFIILLSGCTDFLDRTPYNDLSGSTVWTSDANAIMQLMVFISKQRMDGLCKDIVIILPVSDRTVMTIFVIRI